MIDDRRKLIFVENPKTATCSVKRALMGDDYLDNPEDRRIGSCNHDVPEVIEKKYPAEWGSFRKFVVVRNTWDRAHSFFDFYRNIACSVSYQSMSFDEWVATGCLPPAENHLRSAMWAEGRIDDTLCQLRYVRGVDEVIVLYSFEHRVRCMELEAGIERISALSGDTGQPIPKYANCFGRSARPVTWKRETVDRLGIRYEDEIRRFGFRMPSRQVD